MQDHRGEHYEVAGESVSFRPDIEGSVAGTIPNPSYAFGANEETETYALVLIQWKASPKSKKKRLVLMLLNWIDENHAERRGLLTTYDMKFSGDIVDALPRTRKRFILQ